MAKTGVLPLPLIMKNVIIQCPNWDTILNEYRLLGTISQINTEFSGKKNTKRKKTAHKLKKKRTPTEEFRTNTFNVFMDSIIGIMTRRFNAEKELDSLFNALWLLRHLNDQEIQNKSKKLQKINENDD